MTGILHSDVGGNRVELRLWDTPGGLNDKKSVVARRRWYSGSHVVLLCFSIEKKCKTLQIFGDSMNFVN